VQQEADFGYRQVEPERDIRVDGLGSRPMSKTLEHVAEKYWRARNYRPEPAKSTDQQSPSGSRGETELPSIKLAEPTCEISRIGFRKRPRVTVGRTPDERQTRPAKISEPFCRGPGNRISWKNSLAFQNPSHSGTWPGDTI